MSESTSIGFPTNHRLADRGRCGLLVVDVQPRMLGTISRGQDVVWNATRLLRAAQLFDVTSRATVQYPKGLGPQDERLDPFTQAPIEKQTFSAGIVPAIGDWVRDASLEQVIVCGIEAHVCVAQTAMDLLAAGVDVFVAADAVASRFDMDYETALRRLRDEGATITTTEAILFEWCHTSADAHFKQLSALIREPRPV